MLDYRVFESPSAELIIEIDPRYVKSWQNTCKVVSLFTSNKRLERFIKYLDVKHYLIVSLPMNEEIINSTSSSIHYIVGLIHNDYRDFENLRIPHSVNIYYTDYNYDDSGLDEKYLISIKYLTDGETKSKMKSYVDSPDYPFLLNLDNNLEDKIMIYIPQSRSRMNMDEDVKISLKFNDSIIRFRDSDEVDIGDIFYRYFYEQMNRSKYGSKTDTYSNNNPYLEDIKSDISDILKLKHMKLMDLLTEYFKLEICIIEKRDFGFCVISKSIQDRVRRVYILKYSQNDLTKYKLLYNEEIEYIETKTSKIVESESKSQDIEILEFGMNDTFIVEQIFNINQYSEMLNNIITFIADEAIEDTSSIEYKIFGLFKQDFDSEIETKSDYPSYMKIPHMKSIPDIIFGEQSYNQMTIVNLRRDEILNLKTLGISYGTTLVYTFQDYSKIRLTDLNMKTSIKLKLLPNSVLVISNEYSNFDVKMTFNNDNTIILVYRNVIM